MLKFLKIFADLEALLNTSNILKFLKMLKTVKELDVLKNSKDVQVVQEL